MEEKLYYNTEVEKLAMPEYGRNILKMVEQVKAIPDRQKRSEQAAAVVRSMEILNPQVHQQDNYEQTRKRMPRIGKEIKTPDGMGTVSDLNIIREQVTVRISKGDSFENKVYPLEEIRIVVNHHAHVLVSDERHDVL